MKMLICFFVAMILHAPFEKAYGEEQENSARLLTIYAVSIPGVHQQDKKGSYDTAILEAASQFSNPVKLQVWPPRRTFQAFADCENCCLTPASDNPQFVVFPDVSVSKPIQQARLVIFTKYGSKPITSVEELSGLTVSRRHGISYSKNLQRADINFIFAADLKGSIKMLEQGRTDAFVAFVPDAYKTFEKLGMEPLVHDVESPIAVHEDSLICRGTVGKAFVAAFDSYMDRQQSSPSTE
jgi:hypothetical protein